MPNIFKKKVNVDEDREHIGTDRRDTGKLPLESDVYSRKCL